MDYNQYVQLAQRTSSTRSYPDKVLNGCMGLVGEAGEVVDVVKKRLFQGMDPAKATEKLMGEIGDVLWYCAELSAGLAWDLNDMMNTEDADIIMGSSRYQNMPMSTAAFMLSSYCHMPYNDFIGDMPTGKDDMEYRLWDIVRIISVCKYMLESFCGISLDECMQMNIDKLKARYPEGFDAERSNHRDPKDQ